MKKGFLQLVAGCFAVIIWAGCQSSPAATEPPELAPEAPPVSGLADVASIDIQIIGAGPAQIQVLVRGNLSDGCTTISEINMVQQNTNFVGTITTSRPADAICTEVLVPFERVIPLETEGLPAGTYTVSVNGVNSSFVLENDNVPPTPTPTPVPPGEIAGLVWHDVCGVAGGTEAEPEIVSEGCLEDEGRFRANGELDSDEPGIEGVLLTLGAGACPATGLATAVTDAEGRYSFDNLETGVYCVSIDPLQTQNAPFLVPGSWTLPADETGMQTIMVGAGEQISDVNFGWDYQFLPALNVGGCTDQAEFIEDVTVPDDAIFAPGETFSKTWRIRNAGTCTWGPSYFLVFVAGDPMSGRTVALPVVPPNTEIDLSVELTAPQAEGSYRGDWKIQNPDGDLFGIGVDFDQTIFVRIVVAADTGNGG